MNLQLHFVFLIAIAQALVIGFFTPELARLSGRRWLWGSTFLAAALSVAVACFVTGLHDAKDTARSALFFTSLTVLVAVFRADRIMCAVEAQLEAAPKVVAFARRYFLSLSVNGVITRAGLFEALDKDPDFSGEERKLLELMSDNIEDLGHVIDCMPVSGAAGYGIGAIPIYGISRSDIDSYQQRLRAKYRNWY